MNYVFQAMNYKPVIRKIINYLKNKYILATLVFIAWMSFFDENNMIFRIRSNREIKQLQEDKEFYLKKIQEDKKKLEELRTNNKNLEKFAREQYFMKKANEDIFYIVEDE